MSKKNAIVTGASSGLGKAVVELLTAAGWKVFALARTSKQASFDGAVIKISCNIRDLSAIDAAFAEIDAQTDQIDLLVNCAGRALIKPFEEIAREEIMDVFGVNLKGNIYIAQEVYKRMLSKKQGRIINVGSTSSLRARELETLYCASKWGLRGFTESLRLEAQKHGVFVTGVYPGGMATNFWQADPERDLSGFMKPTAVAKQIMNVVDSDGVAMAEVVIERVIVF